MAENDESEKQAPEGSTVLSCNLQSIAEQLTAQKQAIGNIVKAAGEEAPASPGDFKALLENFGMKADESSPLSQDERKFRLTAAILAGSTTAANLGSTVRCVEAIEDERKRTTSGLMR